MLRLALSIDQVAVLRSARKGKEPDPITMVVMAETVGADGIVCHFREDKKYIKEKDLFLLKEVVKSHLNIKMATTEEMIKIALKVSPDMITFVPELKDGRAMDGGVNVELKFDRIASFTDRLHSNGIIVSYFIDPEVEQLKVSAKAGADYIEINARMYTGANSAEEEEAELHKIISIAQAGDKLGLGISVGGGLNYLNISDIAEISQVEEFNVGHAIISKAMMVGLNKALGDMLNLIR